MISTSWLKIQHSVQFLHLLLLPTTRAGDPTQHRTFKAGLSFTMAYTSRSMVEGLGRTAGSLTRTAVNPKLELPAALALEVCWHESSGCRAGWSQIVCSRLENPLCSSCHSLPPFPFHTLAAPTNSRASPVTMGQHRQLQGFSGDKKQLLWKKGGERAGPTALCLASVPVACMLPTTQK